MRLARHPEPALLRRSGTRLFGSASGASRLPLRRCAVLTRPARSRELAITGATMRSDARIHGHDLPVVFASPILGFLSLQVRPSILRFQLTSDQTVQHVEVLGGQLECRVRFQDTGDERWVRHSNLALTLNGVHNLI